MSWRFLTLLLFTLILQSCYSAAELSNSTCAAVDANGNISKSFNCFSYCHSLSHGDRPDWCSANYCNKDSTYYGTWCQNVYQTKYATLPDIFKDTAALISVQNLTSQNWYKNLTGNVDDVQSSYYGKIYASNTQKINSSSFIDNNFAYAMLSKDISGNLANGKNQSIAVVGYAVYNKTAQSETIAASSTQGTLDSSAINRFNCVNGQCTVDTGIVDNVVTDKTVFMQNIGSSLTQTTTTNSTNDTVTTGDGTLTGTNIVIAQNGAVGYTNPSIQRYDFLQESTPGSYNHAMQQNGLGSTSPVSIIVGDNTSNSTVLGTSDEFKGYATGVKIKSYNTYVGTTQHDIYSWDSVKKVYVRAQNTYPVPITSTTNSVNSLNYTGTDVYSNVYDLQLDAITRSINYARANDDNILLPVTPNWYYNQPQNLFSANKHSLFISTSKVYTQNSGNLFKNYNISLDNIGNSNTPFADISNAMKGYVENGGIVVFGSGYTPIQRGTLSTTQNSITFPQYSDFQLATTGTGATTTFNYDYRTSLALNPTNLYFNGNLISKNPINASKDNIYFTAQAPVSWFYDVTKDSSQLTSSFVFAVPTIVGNKFQEGFDGSSKSFIAPGAMLAGIVAPRAISVAINDGPTLISRTEVGPKQYDYKIGDDIKDASGASTRIDNGIITTSGSVTTQAAITNAIKQYKDYLRNIPNGQFILQSNNFIHPFYDTQNGSANGTKIDPSKQASAVLVSGISMIQQVFGNYLKPSVALDIMLQSATPRYGENFYNLLDQSITSGSNSTVNPNSITLQKIGSFHRLDIYNNKIGNEITANVDLNALSLQRNADIFVFDYDHNALANFSATDIITTTTSTGTLNGADNTQSTLRNSNSFNIVKDAANSTIHIEKFAGTNIINTTSPNIFEYVDIKKPINIRMENQAMQETYFTPQHIYCGTSGICNATAYENTPEASRTNYLDIQASLSYLNDSTRKSIYLFQLDPNIRLAENTPYGREANVANDSSSIPFTYAQNPNAFIPVVMECTSGTCIPGNYNIPDTTTALTTLIDLFKYYPDLFTRQESNIYGIGQLNMMNSFINTNYLLTSNPTNFVVDTNVSTSGFGNQYAKDFVTNNYNVLQNSITNFIGTQEFGGTIGNPNSAINQQLSSYTIPSKLYGGLKFDLNAQNYGNLHNNHNTMMSNFLGVGSMSFAQNQKIFAIPGSGNYISFSDMMGSCVESGGKCIIGNNLNYIAHTNSYKTFNSKGLFMLEGVNYFGGGVTGLSNINLQIPLSSSTDAFLMTSGLKSNLSIADQENKMVQSITRNDISFYANMHNFFSNPYGRMLGFIGDSYSLVTKLHGNFKARLSMSYGKNNLFSNYNQQIYGGSSIFLNSAYYGNSLSEAELAYSNKESNNYYSITTGLLEEKNTALGAQSNGALAINGSRTNYYDVKVVQNLSYGLSVLFNFNYGISNFGSNQYSVINNFSNVHMFKLSAGIFKKIDKIKGSIGFIYTEPNHIIKGSYNSTELINYNLSTKMVTPVITQYSLVGAAMERNYQLMYFSDISKYLSFSVGAMIRQNPYNRSDLPNDRLALTKLTYQF